MPFLPWITLLLLVTLGDCTANSISDIANSLEVAYSTDANYDPRDERFQATITLRNKGDEVISKGDWAIYFCSVRMMEPDVLIPNPKVDPTPSSTGASIGEFIAYHVNGCLFKLVPNNFTDMQPGDTKELQYTGEYWQISRSDVMPNFYVASTISSEAAKIPNTADETINFAEAYTTERQYKRIASDKYAPYTVEERYQKYTAEDKGGASTRVVPQPLYSDITDEPDVTITSSWQVYHLTQTFEASYLAGKLGLSVVTEPPQTKYIQLTVDSNLKLPAVCEERKDEGYTLVVHKDNIIITGATDAAVYYGIQTLLAALSEAHQIGTGKVEDCPRFPYRGFMIDVGRHFLAKDDVIQILEVMSMYKLNKFHFHVSDDEGFRVQIPDLPELSTVGATQCHDMSGDECILPQLGSPPSKSSTGSGFYSKADYQEILQYAAERHIQVIPEVDMPGHAHAMIHAMDARYRQNNDSTYLLIDPDDHTKYLSVQYFTDNAMNPCINSTYLFIDKLIEEFINLHKGIQDLKIFHWGGDEVPGAWLQSPACEDLKHREPSLPLNATVRQFKEYFAKRVEQLTSNLGLDDAAWEDGVITEAGVPINRTGRTQDTYTYAWSNVWEWGSGGHAYDLANSGYKTVISHATHLYFDHPIEPDPEDRGYYWATRYTDSFKVFSFFPDDLYQNIAYDRFGNVITKEGICNDFPCPDLVKRENIVGMQGHIWCETMRKAEQLHGNVFPRMLALAERAWHKADWEDDPTDTESRKVDWELFANRLGYRELARLDALGIKYDIRPPAFSIEDSKLVVKTEFPGLGVDVSTDWGMSWTPVYHNMPVPNSDAVFTTRSADGTRRSRKVKFTASTPSSASLLLSNVFICLISTCFLLHCPLCL